VTSVTSAVVVY